MIDIGANIGDSVAVIRNLVQCPILCIEGDSQFVNIPEKNIQVWDAISLDPVYIGSNSNNKLFSISHQHVTAHLVVSKNRQGVVTVPFLRYNRKMAGILSF